MSHVPLLEIFIWFKPTLDIQRCSILQQQKIEKIMKIAEINKLINNRTLTANWRIMNTRNPLNPVTPKIPVAIPAMRAEKIRLQWKNK